MLRPFPLGAAETRCVSMFVTRLIIVLLSLVAGLSTWAARQQGLLDDRWSGVVIGLVSFATGVAFLLEGYLSNRKSKN
jgi:hypothetical protein